MIGGWTREQIGGHPADVFRPPGRPRFGVLFLHPVGLETLAGDAAYSALFATNGLACVCPLAGASWWADKISPVFDPAVTPERHLLANVVPYFASEWGLRPPAIALLGISMGGQGALRLAFKHPATFPVVAGVASAVDYHDWYGRGTPLDDLYDSKEQARQDTATLHVHPSHHPAHLFFCVDPLDREWWRGNDRLHEKLAALGVEHQCDLATRAGGHSWAYFDAMAGRAITHLASGLEQQARRLL